MPRQQSASAEEFAGALGAGIPQARVFRSSGTKQALSPQALQRAFWLLLEGTDQCPSRDPVGFHDRAPTDRTEKSNP